MQDLEDRLRDHLTTVQAATPPIPGDLTGLPSRARARQRVERRRTIGGALLTTALLVGAISYLVAGGGESDDSVVASSPKAAELGIRFEHVGSLPDQREGSTIRASSAGGRFAAWGTASDGAPALWLSEDGAHWTHEVVDTSDRGDMFAGFTAGDGYEVVYGDDTGDGPTLGTDRRAMAWVRSDDGPWVATRLPEADGPDSGPRHGWVTDAGPVLIGLRLEFPAGVNGEVLPTVVVWSLHDGTTWESHEVDVHDLDPKQGAAGLLALRDGAILQTQTAGLPDPRFWLTSDGATWAEVTNPEADTPEIASGPAGLIATGMAHDAPAAWASADDGRSWSRLALPALEPEAQFRNLTASADLVAVLTGTMTDEILGEPGNQIQVQRQHLQLLLSDGGAFGPTYDLTASLGLGAYRAATSMAIVGDRVLVDLMTIPTDLQSEPASDLWIGTVHRR